jgi:hypothetical protein
MDHRVKPGGDEEKEYSLRKCRYSPRRQRAADIENERTERAGEQARADRSDNHRVLDTRERTGMSLTGEMSDIEVNLAMGHSRNPLAVCAALARPNLPMLENDAPDEAMYQ